MNPPCSATHVRVARLRSGPVLLTVAELRHAAALSDAARAAEFRAGRTWLRRVLGDYLGADPLALRLATTEWGKPYVVGHAVHFNLSHTPMVGASPSASLGVLAVSDRPVGIDVEPVNRDLRKALGRCTSPRERHRLAGSPTAHAVTVWTVKEAYAKALGLGHRLTFADLETDEPVGGETWTVRQDADLLVDVLYDVPDHVLAVARARDCPVSIVEVATDGVDACAVGGGARRIMSSRR